jgi:thioredoxin:protein disulfide reductase
MHHLKTLFIAWLVLTGSLLQARPSTFDPVQDVAISVVRGSLVLELPEVAHVKVATFQVALKAGTAGTLEAGPLPAGSGRDELGDPIWRDRVTIPLHGEHLAGTVTLVVTYQPCTEGDGGVCFPPTRREVPVRGSAIPAAVPAPGSAALPSASPTGQAAESAPAAAPPAPAPTPASTGPAPAAPAAPAQAPAVQGLGLLGLLLTAFGFGLSACLSPCVYPMITITLAIIGAKGGGPLRGFLLSLALVLGMSVTYTTLGVLAALTGGTFGKAGQHPAFLIPVALFFAVFSLSLFGAFEIRLPDALTARLQQVGSRKGHGGAFLMGLVLGPLAAPCVGPNLGPVLTLTAQRGQATIGALALFTYSLGMGVLFLVVGTFSASLPRSGNWLVKLKQLMGIVVLGFAVWTVRNLAPEWLNQAFWAATLLVAAGVLEAFRPAETLLRGLGKGMGLLALVVALLLGVRAVEGALDLALLPTGSAPKAAATGWLEQDLEGALARARTEGKVVVLDTYATWCAQCKELDGRTWPDPQVAAWLRDHAVAVRIDTDRVRPDLALRYGIRSYPTVLVLDAQGRERGRSEGFQPPGPMLAFLGRTS